MKTKTIIAIASVINWLMLGTFNCKPAIIFTPKKFYIFYSPSREAFVFLFWLPPCRFVNSHFSMSAGNHRNNRPILHGFGNSLCLNLRYIVLTLHDSNSAKSLAVSKGKIFLFFCIFFVNACSDVAQNVLDYFFTLYQF